MNPDLIVQAIECLKNQDEAGAIALLEQFVVEAATGGEVAAEDPGADDPGGEALADDPDVLPEDKDDEDDEKDKDAAAAALRRLTGAKSIGDALLVLDSWSSRVAAIEADERRIDDVKRKALVGQLVAMGKESPASAYADRANGVLCDRLARMPLKDLSDLVALHRAESAGAHRHRPPVSGGAKSVVTPKIRSLCEKRGITVEEFLARRETAVRRVGQ